MKKSLLVLTTSTLLLVSATSCDTLQSVVNTTLGGSSDANALSNDQVIGGLKDALKQGTSKGVDILSAKDGFFRNQAIKILFPSEAQKVEKTLRDIGLGSMVDDAIEKLNRAAEDAAVGAKDIFVGAITQMTVNDAMNILMGEKNACTEYLKRTTSQALYDKFNPVIKTSLDKVGALKIWNEVISRYNKVPFVQQVNPNLDDHVTKKALEGLFVMVEKEEREIRVNPAQRLTDLMKRVFAKQDNR